MGDVPFVKKSTYIELVEKLEYKTYIVTVEQESHSTCEYWVTSSGPNNVRFTLNALAFIAGEDHSGSCWVGD